ncbi:MAG: tetratricopeptide repeat protein, partial [Desulfobacterales bacterium]|nr:tetratricopeptide repeat protein [Desulfobacterales bacterium]
INPDYVDARMKLGIVQICMKQYDQALSNLESLVEQNPDYPDVYYLIGLVKENRGQLEEGIRFQEKALRISPKFKNVLVKLILLYSRTGNPTAAENTLKQAMDLFPNDRRLASIKTHLNLFQLSPETKEDSDEFQRYFKNEQSLRVLRNEFHPHLDIMPSCSEILKMFNKTRYVKCDSGIPHFLIPLIHEQITHHPDYPDLYNSLGIQLTFCNQLSEAEDAFSKAVDLAPGYLEARINLVKSLSSSGKHKAACDHGNVLLANNIQFPDVCYTLTRVFMACGDYDTAMKTARCVLTYGSDMRKIRILIARIRELRRDTTDGRQSTK